MQHPFAKKVQPKMRKMVIQQIKLVAKWFHTQFSWKLFLMSWMVVLIASKMLLLALTYQYFSLTSLVSLQVYHGVWTVTFFILTLLDPRARLLPLPASCLLAGYLPATTVLHILLIPNHFPLPYIITDASTTLLSILIMFLLLRMECGQILSEAEQMWQQQSQFSSSDSETNSTTTSDVSVSPHLTRQVLNTVEETLDYPQYQEHPSMNDKERREIHSNSIGYEEAIDLEPIDFEHFMEEPDLERNHPLEMFRVTFGEDQARGR